MANGVPVRLSEALTVRARAASQVLDRSMTEQVEHWARLGQVVEAVIGSATVHQLKSRSFDPDLQRRLAVASSADGRAMAAKLIRERNPGQTNGHAKAATLTRGVANGHAKLGKRTTSR